MSEKKGMKKIREQLEEYGFQRTEPAEDGKLQNTKVPHFNLQN